MAASYPDGQRLPSWAAGPSPAGGGRAGLGRGGGRQPQGAVPDEPGRPPQLRRPGGRIVNLSSVAAFTGRGGPYPAAKAGLVGLTCALALELGPLGITANAVAPGFIEDTEFFGGGLGEQGRHVNGGWVLGR